MVMAAPRMNVEATIARLVVGMAWTARVIPRGCCGNYAKAVRDLEEVERTPTHVQIYRIATFA